MRLGFRVRLFGIVAITAAALLAITLGSSILTARVERDLRRIQTRYLPLIELEPQLQGELERIQRGFQDAVAAHDLAALEGVHESRDQFLARLAAARNATDPKDAAALEASVDDYFTKAMAVSRRLISDDTGEGVVDAISAMQASQLRTAALVKRTAALDRKEMASAFATAVDAETTASRYRLWLSIACITMAAVLTLVLSGNLARAVTALTEGLARFGRGEFGQPITVVGDDELAGLARHANEMAASLDRLDHERRRIEAALTASNKELEAFSYSVAHDLRAPLRGINGYSHALVEDYGDGLDVEARRYLDRISAAAERMGELIDALLALSRVTRSEFRRSPVNLSQLADAVVKHLQAGDPDRAVDFACADGVVVDGDEALLRAVLENLLGNAWKFTGKQTPAQISFGVESGFTYYVRDNGAGFDMSHAQKLFAPFQRLHTQREFTGTGVGLATVQRIVNRHGGRIWAEGAVGRGATFFFTLSGDQHEAKT